MWHFLAALSRIGLVKMELSMDLRAAISAVKSAERLFSARGKQWNLLEELII